MPRTDNYQYSHPWATPEPHFIPGYTGYLPGYGPKRIYQLGKTYGRMTHDIMANDSVAGLRLAPLDIEHSRVAHDRDDVWERENRMKDAKRRHDVVSGYAGYIPRKLFHFGKGYVPESREATEEYETLLERRRDIPRMPAPQNIFPPDPTMPKIVLDRHRQIPKYTSYLNPMNFNESPTDICGVEPKPKYAPGYMNYNTAQVLDPAMYNTDYRPPQPTSVLDRPALKGWYCNKERGIPGNTFSQIVCQRCGHSPGFR